MSSNQTHLTSLLTNTKMTCSHKYPSATPQKIPIFITTTSLSFKRTLHIHTQICLYFSRFMWAFWGLSWSEFFHRENRKQSQNLLTLPLSSKLSLHLLTHVFTLSSFFIAVVAFSFFCPHPFFLYLFLSCSHSICLFLSSFSLCFCNSCLHHLLRDQGFLWRVCLICDPMSKKMKQAALGTSLAYGGRYEDAKTRQKHQTLLQDYQDLLKEADDMRNKLDIAKQRKLILLAEVRFLRRRHKYLLKIKSLNRPQEQPINIEKKHKLGKKERNLPTRETNRFKLPPLPDLKHKGRVYAGKEGATKNMTPSLDLNRKVSSCTRKQVANGFAQTSDSNYKKRISSAKEAAVPNAEVVVNLNQNEKLQGGNGNGSGTRMPVFDLNQDTSFSGKEGTLPMRTPIFDLNEISMEEEEIQNGYELPNFEEPKKSLTRAGNEEQPTDMKLSICRNAGEGSSRMGKRKISWQDPVALSV